MKLLSLAAFLALAALTAAPQARAQSLASPPVAVAAPERWMSGALTRAAAARDALSSLPTREAGDTREALRRLELGLLATTPSPLKPAFLLPRTEERHSLRFTVVALLPTVEADGLMSETRANPFPFYVAWVRTLAIDGGTEDLMTGSVFPLSGDALVAALLRSRSDGVERAPEGWQAEVTAWLAAGGARRSGPLRPPPRDAPLFDQPSFDALDRAEALARLSDRFDSMTGRLVGPSVGE